MPFLDFIFPKHCLNCNQLGTYICPNCLPTLQRHQQICVVCRKHSPWGATHNHCRPHTTINHLIIACVYQDTLKHAIHQIKYKYAYDIIQELCEKALQSEKIRQFFHQTQVQYVTEIPSHHHKQNLRGFNLPTFVAQWISRNYQIPHQQFLIKTTSTIPQASLHRQDRLFNIQQTFSIKNEELLKQSNVLIVDDVITTGTTLEEAAKLISLQQPDAISVLALASSK